MRDETPREPIRETPAPDGPPPPHQQPRHYETNAPRFDRPRSSSGGLGQGIMAALGLAATFVMIEAAAMVMVLVAAHGDEAATLATWAGVAVLVAGVVAAVFVSRRLPREARTPFWAMGTVCVASALIFLVTFCGVKPPRIGG